MSDQFFAANFLGQLQGFVGEAFGLWPLFAFQSQLSEVTCVSSDTFRKGQGLEIARASR